MFDNIEKKKVPLECKHFVKYLDIHLSWKDHVNYIETKLRRSVGLISKLGHFVPRHTLLIIYQSLLHHMQPSRTNLSTKSFSHFGAKVWNEIPQVKTNYQKKNIQKTYAHETSRTPLPRRHLPEYMSAILTYIQYS